MTNEQQYRHASGHRVTSGTPGALGGIGSCAVLHTRHRLTVPWVENNLTLRAAVVHLQQCKPQCASAGGRGRRCGGNAQVYLGRGARARAGLRSGTLGLRIGVAVSVRLSSPSPGAPGALTAAVLRAARLPQHEAGLKGRVVVCGCKVVSTTCIPVLVCLRRAPCQATCGLACIPRTARAALPYSAPQKTAGGHQTFQGREVTRLVWRCPASEGVQLRYTDARELCRLLVGPGDGIATSRRTQEESLTNTGRLGGALLMWAGGTWGSVNKMLQIKWRPAGAVAEMCDS